VIDEEEQNIRKMVELNKRSRTDKTRILAALDEATRTIAEQRQTLKGMLVRALQTA